MTKLTLSDLRENSNTIVKAKQVEVEVPFAPVKYYIHGWQSWSLAAWADPKPIPMPKPTIFHPMQADVEHAHKKYLNGSWLGAVEFVDGNILFIGALGIDANVSLQKHQDASTQSLIGQSDTTDETHWLIAFGEETSIFEKYAEEVGNRLGRIDKTKEAPRVWCSWYSLYERIDESSLYSIFTELDDLPFDVLQVDDGWQIDIGDWQANHKFSSGMQALADKIKATGRIAGIWLAPLIATSSSRLFRENPQWFLRSESDGTLVSAGCNWGERLYALDTTRPDVTAWLVELMQTVRSWGFDYLKLDFLYGGALKGKRFRDMPREAAYRECLQTLRDAMGADAFFLTCGTPILPAIGLCDAMRIGPDVACHWENFLHAQLLYNFAIPGTKNAIRTTIHRLWLKPLVHIDPDVGYFESKWNELTKSQRLLLQNLLTICEFKATSDLPQWMKEDERNTLRSFLETRHDVAQIGRYVFRIDEQQIDFTSAMSLPPLPQRLMSLLGNFLAWLVDGYIVWKILKICKLDKPQRGSPDSYKSPPPKIERK